ncbi:AAA domain-containing protein [Rhodococcus sp. IEGM 1409]|uniref:AAA domain-containing protein n=1 Tax=Rhodococcus sp. IEGM 1409 TaxID=3047082 RepID=UPI0024B6B54E|nr:AAA domain-containing protein [Rhodococcus sp. IEGM 1409]MDI9898377.1 AAA domain-containing protein [Rhodococcus sp. IEGM 1409]
MTGPRELLQGESIVTVDGEEWPEIISVLEFSNPTVSWVRLFRGVDKSYSRPSSQVEVRALPALSALAGDALDYWRRAVDALPPVDGSEDPLKRTYAEFKKVHPESALAHILSARPLEFSEPLGLAIEPFSSNVSQREAVNIALRHRVSVIEGPPGTGKTQAILNLVASLIAEPGTSVGVVSANNAAIDNVVEKLNKQGYGFVVAELGNKTRRDAFYAGQEERNRDTDRWLAARVGERHGDQNEADSRIATLNRLQGDERQLRKLQDSLAMHRHEFERFEVWLGEESVNLSESGILAGRPAQRILTLLAESEFDTQTGPVRTWMRRLSRRIRFGDLRDIDLEQSDDVISLHRLYYERRIKELADEVDRLSNRLESAGMERLLDEQAELSKRVLDDGLVQRYADSSRPKFDQKDSGRNNRKLLREYPVVVSTCHSLRRSIGADTLLDVVIIDEASQLDLLAGALAMANCRNLVVVGDLQQLSHIAPALSTDIGPPPHTALDVTCHSVLSSLTSLYGSATPRTMLREHYRCDPAIIEFCNTKFYGGELIPYREGTATGPALLLVRTVEGNHMRHFHAGGFLNHREIDSITRELMPSLLTTYSADQIGIVSPYRKQANVATTSLGESGADTQSDTVHKYQGREKDVMIFTAVLDDSWRGRLGVKFVDDPRLVNVAVSRAVDRFILVTHKSGLPESRHLRDLVGYIEFRNPDSVRDSRLVSIFDLLYTSYASELRGLNRRIRGRSKYPSENIAWTMLEEILEEEKYRGLALSSQVLLRELVPVLDRLTERQVSYVQHRASVDFVVRNAITRQPILAIEVDGYQFHENKPEQLARDDVKNSIFGTLEMSLLRLPTTGHGEADLVRNELDAALAGESRVKADR